MAYSRTPFSAPRRRLSGSSGITLLEILFIVALIGILLIIGIPSLFRQIQRMKVEQAVAQSVGFLQSARLRAVRDQNAYTVNFDTTTGEIQGVSSGLPGDSDERQTLDLDSFGVSFYSTGYTGLPPGFEPDCDVPPVAGIQFDSTGVVTGAPVEFCITDIFGNIMQISFESLGGQPRVRKFFAEVDPHNRYANQTAGFFLQDEQGPWRWY